MIFYLLPSEKKQSAMDLIKEDYFSVWEDRDKNRFLELNPYRKELIDYFKVETKPLAPAWRRYKGSFWDSLEFWCLPPEVQQKIIDRGVIISPLFGMLGVNDSIPRYSVTFQDTYKGEKLVSFWKEILKEISQRMFEGATVFDFLTREQRETLTFPKNVTFVKFEYVRKRKKVVNPMAHRAYTLRYIVEKNLDLNSLEKINFYDYTVSNVEKEGNTIKVIMESEGKYI